MHDLRALFSVALLALLGVRKVVAQECDEVVDAVVRTKPDCGAVVVDKSGEHSESTTVQEGVDALSVDEAGVQSLFIYPGVYFEQVVRLATLLTSITRH